MKFTIINNQPVKRVLPMAGYKVIEPYGTLVINKSEKFRKSFENLSFYGYSIHCEEDISDLKNTGSVNLITEKPILPKFSKEYKNNIDKLEIKEEKFKSLEDEIKSTEEDKPEKIQEEPVIEKELNKENPISEEVEIQEAIKEESKLEEKKEEVSEAQKVQEEKETRESVLNKCKSLPADTLRAILREIGVTSTSNNTNTLFNKISNSEANDEILISAYHKVVDKNA